MPQVSAEVATPNASSYLRKLCQHWAHKFTVEYNDQHGTIQLPSFLCTLDASPDKLAIVLDLNEGADLARAQSVVEEHIRRFGFKEELVFLWTTTSAEPQASSR